MSELERELLALAAAVDWPATPELVVRGVQPRPARPIARPLVIALAAGVLALGVAFAVPSARGAILHFLGVGGVRVERVETLPPARTQPLREVLGTPVDAAQAQAVLGSPFVVPAGTRGPQLYVSGDVVSALLDTSEGPVLLSELSSFPAGMLVKKLAAGGTRITPVHVGAGRTGFWLSGAAHVVIGPALPPRLAGNVLLVDVGRLTIRLEGAHLRLEQALALAGTLRP